ncbi:integral membrane protein [Liquorilactobacillus ghanensis DSM 18630]|jgi:branched-subunit amino acid transport protein|uniref:Integral membrane protein n=1 Tax=Liquorilactobacillus ghanensis DSM 18630 TaxID=1423750 RepID=A0A0R1VLP7_9LACO|nr:AzlD domain-containing protein [Liquorilactobacillus ghanensis]KRM06253.1 integral membrane protein [Liquorilactobacillus ghanensis DSM 18630]
MAAKTTEHFVLIILSMLVAFGPRFIPLRIFSTRKIPVWFNEWMKYVPVSLFTALVVKDIFIDANHGYTFTGIGNLAKILAAIIVIAVAYRTRSMGLAVVLGLVAVTLLTFALAL